MLYREIIVVFSQIHIKHINTLCGQNVQFLNVKPGGTYSNQWSSDGRFTLHLITTRNISYLYPPQTTQVYYETEAFLLQICTIATAVKAMCKCQRDLNVQCGSKK